MLATASVIAVVFFIIYFVVQTAVYGELDNDLAYEANRHTKEIYIQNDAILFRNKNEWEEKEHREVQVNPVFIQLVNKEGQPMDKSPNLKEDFLVLNEDKGFDIQFDTQLSNSTIRQIQIPIKQNENLKGYIITAMSLEGPKIVLESLRKNLFILFPIVLMGLFFITRFLAGRSIIPVQTITNTADRITRNSLNERIPLPLNKDELFILTSSINQLLDRMQEAIEREKQFTADASHQLRTPLAVLKGTLEVLIRKPRTEEIYQERIQYSIQEINRISEIVDQLLILARFDKTKHKLVQQPINLQTTVDDVLHRYRGTILEKGLAVNVKAIKESVIQSDPYYIDLILDNVLSNAIKYTRKNSAIDILISKKENQLYCQIQDQGIGIKTEDIDHIFNPFFRSDALEHKNIKGNGLGLSIVKKASELLDIKITITSELKKGTCFTLSFGDTNKAS